VALIDDLERAADAAAVHAHDGEVVTAVLAAEADAGARRYVCALETGAEDAQRAWVVVDDAGAVITSRIEIRDAVTIAALCEIAADAAGGGDLDDLLSRLVATRLTESPPGIEEAEEAVRELQVAIGTPPAVATPARLDRIGTAARHLEQALDPTAGSPFANAMRSAQEAVAELTREVERGYRVPLDAS
jgi:hypothetical protein